MIQRTDATMTAIFSSCHYPYQTGSGFEPICWLPIMTMARHDLTPRRPIAFDFISASFNEAEPVVGKSPAVIVEDIIIRMIATRTIIKIRLFFGYFFYWPTLIKVDQKVEHKRLGEFLPKIRSL